MSALSEAVAAHVRHDEPCECSPLVKVLTSEMRALAEMLPPLIVALDEAIDAAAGQVVAEAERVLGGGS